MVRAAPERLGITWIGHSSFLVQIGGRNVLTDPIWSERASPLSFAGPKRHVAPGVAFDKLPPVDLVLVSHDHYDHLDNVTVRRLVNRFPLAMWCVPLGVSTFLRKRGAAVITELDWQQTAHHMGLSITCVPAKHFSGRGLTTRNRTLWCGWTVGSAAKKMYFAGDTATIPEFGSIAASSGPFDAAILPIGAYAPRWLMRSVHMNPRDCTDAYKQVFASQSGHSLTLTASHWGTFKLTDEPLDEPPEQMRKEWRAAGLRDSDLWIPRHGETRWIE